MFSLVEVHRPHTWSLTRPTNTSLLSLCLSFYTYLMPLVPFQDLSYTHTQTHVYFNCNHCSGRQLVCSVFAEHLV